MPKKTSRRSRQDVLSERDYVLLAAFRHRLRNFIHFSENAARSVGLQPQQHQALLVIRGFLGGHSVSVGELADQLKIRHHSAVELVARMVSKGLVTKTADPEDGRRVIVGLTAKSRRALGELSSSHKAELARVGPALREILVHLKIIS